MGMMAKMRSLAPWFIITVGGLFVLFMVLSDSQLVNIVGQRSNNIGYVNDEPITYQQFSNFLESARRQQQAESGEDLSETQLEMLRDEVWNAYVNQLLINEKIDEFGIIVTDEEVEEAILGPNPPAFLRQNFIDTNGVFNREAYEQALFNPQNAEALIQAEEQVRRQKVQEKLRAYLTGSVVVTEGELKRKFIEQNTQVSAEYALVQYNMIPDSAVEITESDLRDYYNDNKSDYTVEPKRKIKYVLFERKPSLEDTTAIRSNLEAIVEDLKSDTTSFRNYVNIYSEEPYRLDTLTVDKIHPNAVTILKEASEGEVIGPVLSSEGYTVYKLVDKYGSTEQFARASHILVSGTDDEAKQKADSVYQALQDGADFVQTAMDVSEDPGSGSRGGDLGWFGKGQMVPEFENAVFSGSVGVIQKPVQSQFGYHIIKVADRSNTKYVVEKIVNSINASGSTLDRVFERAGDFAYLADENGFEAEAELMELDVVETQPFDEKVSFIPGLGQSNALKKFVFDNSVGTISDVIRVPSGYVVAKISEAIKGGFKPFEEVEKQLRISLLRERKFDMAMEIAQDIYNNVKDDGSLSKAPEFSDYVKFEYVTSFSPSGNIPTVGRDQAFAAYALVGELKKISKPIRGNKGAYLIRLSSRTEFDEEEFAKQKQNLRASALQQKKSQIYVDWIASLKEEADIEDNRHLFYR
ncbi:MAG: peptidylprolyl isomerase [Melioribacteraceae bacterium]|nr:peptidylprolyl isomerase [Melioribacteraceae bacterium]